MNSSSIRKSKIAHWLPGLACSVTLACASSYGFAAGEASRLAKDLTPVGADPNGNKEQMIPKWEGKDQPLAGYSFGKNRGEYSKYKDEKPLFSIDASNVDKHADKLTPGQLDLIKKKKGYRMDVFPSHRNCGFPDFVTENTKKNATEAKLAPNGFDIQEAYVPGLPFPIPASGAEAMWNAKLTYKGVGTYFENFVARLSPVKGGSDWINIKQNQVSYYPWGEKGSKKISQIPPYEMMIYYEYLTPAAIAGMNAIINNKTTDSAESYIYFPGQRRVRRMPTYAYDAPFIGFENQYTVDSYNMFFGRMDRFDWKLVGKKEVYIPNNAFARYDRKLDPSKVLKDDMVNPDGSRYELHRVWVVEATVKQGVRHVSPKRTFYLDEDTWSISVAEDYDAQGKIWKVREAWQIPVWELGGTCTFSGFVGYDLNSGRYVVDTNSIGAGREIEWFADSKARNFLKVDFFGPESLRSRSER